MNYLEIAEFMRPNIEREKLKAGDNEDLLDLVRCALIQKAKEEKEIRILDNDRIKFFKED